ncbi:pyrimidine pathway regulatory 1 [Fusarium globosum]|uniref:Pyrimidine pathway regulatory 1 n=1 Tax=Fusarium globosum TaxID=78864 RepID=A0A8H5XYH2_9HYPO|nr:pyrimidine pathway regulatory 1 [Fusarium globosum]
MSQPPRKRPRHTSEVENRPASAAACERCRSRKVKCGAEFPRCKGCLKANTPCIIADPSAKRPYTREEVFALEQKLKDLQERVAAIDIPVSDQGDPVPPRQVAVGRIAHPPDVVRLFHSFLLSRLHSASDRVQQGPSRPSDDIPTPLTRIEYHSPHPFPAPHIAMQAIDHYFKEFHVAHPILQKEALQSCLERAPDWSTQDRINLTDEQRHDIFQLYMAIAIGSIRLFREKTFDQHPFGFFTAALEMNPPAESHYNTLGNIENLILIARFGVYYNIGCSLKFFELTYQEERLRLIRVTIEVLSSKAMLPPAVLLEPCLQAARAIICSFAALRGWNMITFSRAYMHLIFTAALVIVAVLETRTHPQDGRNHKTRSSGIDADDWLRDLVDDRWSAEARDIWNDLSVAGSLLSWFADSMPDMAVYNQFFQKLRHQLETSGSSREQPPQLVLENAAPAYETNPPRNTPPSDTSNAENNAALNTGDPLGMDGMNALDLTSIQVDNPQFGTLSEGGMPEGWPLAYVLGVEGISAGLSEFVWDTVVPWEESPAG